MNKSKLEDYIVGRLDSVKEDTESGIFDLSTGHVDEGTDPFDAAAAGYMEALRDVLAEIASGRFN